MVYDYINHASKFEVAQLCYITIVNIYMLHAACDRDITLSESGCLPCGERPNGELTYCHSKSQEVFDNYK